MKNDLIDFQDIPKRLYGNCYKDFRLCLVCQNKEDEYKKNPCNLWDELPLECKFEGWIFLQREEIKRKIRKKKEKIVSLTSKLKNADGIKFKRIKKEIERYKKEIDSYHEQGSDNW